MLADLLIDRKLFAAKWLQGAGFVVQHADGVIKTIVFGAFGHYQGVFRPFIADPEHRIDIDLETRMLGQQSQFAFHGLEALHGHVVRLEIVDADLHLL